MPRVCWSTFKNKSLTCPVFLAQAADNNQATQNALFADLFISNIPFIIPLCFPLQANSKAGTQIYIWFVFFLANCRLISMQWISFNSLARLLDDVCVACPALQ